MTMLEETSFLSSRYAPSVPNLRQHAAGQRRAGGLKSRSSVAALVSAVRDPRGAVEGWWDGSTQDEREHKLQSDARLRVLYLQMRDAVKYEEWKCAAEELDRLENSNEWKRTAESPEYDPEVIQSRLNQLEEARINCDVRRMVFLIRTSLTRNLGNMGNIRLYKHSHIGTKDLIERYINSALSTLDSLLELSDKGACNGFGPRRMMEQVLLARQAFGRSALLLSGGATFGMCHSGVLKALWAQKLLPRIISGASAGSIISSVLCTRTDEEVPELMATFCYGDLAVFEEEGGGETIFTKLARFLKYGSLFDIAHLTRVMRELLGDLTFQEAYNRTRRILNICVSSAGLYELPRLLNYVTAPNVLIWSAVAASCSVPLVFTAASLLAKDPRTGEIQPWNPSPQKWIDGSVDNDLPMTRLSEMFNVNHFIVSQVNPHVVPFIKAEEAAYSEPTDGAPKAADGSSWLYTLTNLAKSEAVHRMHTLIDMGILPTTLTKTVSVLSQKYSGDITILPEVSYEKLTRLLSNPTPEFMEDTMLAGERATWPKFSRIRNHLAIELALDETAQKLRERVVFSSSQVDLRLASRTNAKIDGKPRRTSSKNSTQGRQRKWSQSSEPDATTADTAKFGRLDPLQQTSHHKSQSVYSSSRQNVGKIPQIQVNRQDSMIPPAPFSGLSDVASSGAETSNFYTSDSPADLSSPSESPTSPISPTDGGLFAAYSVPATPAGHRKTTSYFSLPKLKPSIDSTVQKLIPNAVSRGSSKAKGPDNGENIGTNRGRPKSLSRSATSNPRVEQSRSTSGGKPANKKTNPLSLNLDMSSPRSIMTRRKGDH